MVQTVRVDQHAGRWTCAGRLIGSDEDSSDDFEVLVTGKSEWLYGNQYK